jgi:hypothetical protein
MKISAPPFLRRSLVFAGTIVSLTVLTACTGVGGGQLPPSIGFTGSASFGFDFNCEDMGGLNPQTGQLRIQLAYTDHGSNPLGSSFSIHGIADELDPILESQVCSGQEPPPASAFGNQLIFLGRYRLTSPPPAGFPSSTCPARETTATPLCRFEVIVRDNDQSFAPSPGDYFSIKLSTVTESRVTDFDPTTVVYARAGLLASGNLTVD